MNIGVHHGILEKKHVDAIGSCPLSLYLWCLHHQTKHSGWVLGGTPITYEKINEKLGQKVRTLQRWMSILVDSGYLEVTYTNYHQMRIQVMKSKKFAFRQLHLPIERPAKSGGVPVPNSARSGGGRPAKSGGGLVKSGGVNKSGSLKCIESTPIADPPVCIPTRDWIPLYAWLEFIKMRKAMRCPPTAHAVDLLINDLERMRAIGEDPREVLEQSIKNGWRGLFPVRKEGANARNKIDERREREQRAIEKVTGRRSGLVDALREGIPGRRDGGARPVLPEHIVRPTPRDSAQSISARGEVLQISSLAS